MQKIVRGTDLLDLFVRNPLPWEEILAQSKKKQKNEKTKSFFLSLKKTFCFFSISHKKNQ